MLATGTPLKDRQLAEESTMAAAAGLSPQRLISHGPEAGLLFCAGASSPLSAISQPGKAPGRGACWPWGVGPLGEAGPSAGL